MQKDSGFRVCTSGVDARVCLLRLCGRAGPKAEPLLPGLPIELRPTRTAATRTWLISWTPPPFFVANGRLFRGAFRSITTTKSMAQGPRPDCDAHDAVPESALRLL